MLVLVFQEGWLLEKPLSFEATGIIESWLPLFLFSILFGLSMDYHMFIMGRIKEGHERGLSNDEAISAGVKATAATITNAAAIMVAVATIFALTRDISPSYPSGEPVGRIVERRPPVIEVAGAPCPVSGLLAQPRGSPSPRIAATPRMISLVPPPIVSATLNW